MNFEPGKDREEKINKFLDIMASYHSYKTEHPAFHRAVGDIRDSLQTLNVNIKEANESSTKLTKALNKITLFGVIIAGSGIVVASASFILELIKYLHAK